MSCNTNNNTAFPIYSFLTNSASRTLTKFTENYGVTYSRTNCTNSAAFAALGPARYYYGSIHKTAVFVKSHMHTLGNEQREEAGGRGRRREEVGGGGRRREGGSSRGLTVLVLQRHKLTNDVTFAQLQIKLLYSLYFIIVSNITYINLLILDSRTRSGEPGCQQKAPFYDKETL